MRLPVWLEKILDVTMPVFLLILVAIGISTLVAACIGFSYMR